MKHRTLKAYTKAVNALARAGADAMNKAGGYKQLFKAVHHDLPERVAEHYFNEGYTPQEMLDKMTAAAEYENACEARMS